MSTAAPGGINRTTTLYAQHLTQQLPPQDTEDAARYGALIRELAAQVEAADAIVVGAGSGLSSAAGYDFYHRTAAFDNEFAAFERECGFSTLFDGLYHLYSTNEQRWAFTAQFIRYIRNAPEGQPYRDLRAILGNRAFHVLTTNVDAQFAHSFPGQQVCLFQGDMRYFQCSQPCHDALYDNAEQVERMARAIEGTMLPPELLPRCPECGHLMMPWVRDNEFLQGAFWREQVQRYEQFVDTHLKRNSHVLFLELGVGGMTPGIIELPFWSMTANNPHAFYACINQAKAQPPAHLSDKALTITANLATVLTDLRSHLGA